MQKVVCLVLGMMCGAEQLSGITMKKSYQCDHCDAEFKISHKMDEEYYEVNFCPFCGAQVDDEEDDEEDDE